MSFGGGFDCVGLVGEFWRCELVRVWCGVFVLFIFLEGGYFLCLIVLFALSVRSLFVRDLLLLWNS